MRLTEEQRARLEADAREAFDAGDMQRTATIAVRGYGTEVYSLLASIHREPEDASDVFAQVTESFWKSLPTFAWACSLRTWLYTLARGASFRFRRDAARKARRGRPVGESALDAVAHRVRTETLSFLKTEKRTRAQALRESLPAEDQFLLVLRVDRGLAWNELARVMSEGDLPADEATLSREAARLRKRFQVLKERLLAMARPERTRSQ